MPTGLGDTPSATSLGGCLTTTCTSVRRGVRTTRSSTAFPPLPRAVAKRSPLSEKRTCSTPFTSSRHQRPPLSGAQSMPSEASGISMDRHLRPGLEPRKPGFAAPGASLNRTPRPRRSKHFNTPHPTSTDTAPHSGRSPLKSVNILARSKKICCSPQGKGSSGWCSLHHRYVPLQAAVIELTAHTKKPRQTTTLESRTLGRETEHLKPHHTEHTPRVSQTPSPLKYTSPLYF